MIIADTSIWIDHFRSPDEGLLQAVSDGLLLMHEFVIAELALGSVPDRLGLFELLGAFPLCETLESEELLEFIETHRLMSLGIGFVDTHLLASTARTPSSKLWTRDKRLHVQAERLGLAHLS